MSLWHCPKHGLYGGDIFCPKCGGGGEMVTFAMCNPSEEPTEEEIPMAKWDTEFDLSAVNANTPATARIMISRRTNGDYELLSTEDDQETMLLLDKAMEAIDGQRLPPTE